MHESNRTPAPNPPQEGQSALITLRQAAEESFCSVSTLRNLIARGDLTAYRFGPRMIRVRREDLAGLLKPYESGQAGSWSHLR